MGSGQPRDRTRPRLVDVYNYYVNFTTATFEESLAEPTRWRSALQSPKNRLFRVFGKWVDMGYRLFLLWRLPNLRVVLKCPFHYASAPNVHRLAIEETFAVFFE